MTARSSLASMATLWLTLASSGCGDDGGSTDAGPPAVNQCTGAQDLAIIHALASTLDGGISDGGVPDGGPYPPSYVEGLRINLSLCANETCIVAILNDEGGEECMVDCLEMTAAGGISPGCIACQNEVIRCAAANCITLCLGSDEDACDACSFEHCGPRLVDCTGLPLP